MDIYTINNDFSNDLIPNPNVENNIGVGINPAIDPYGNYVTPNEQDDNGFTKSSDYLEIAERIDDAVNNAVEVGNINRIHEQIQELGLSYSNNTAKYIFTRNESVFDHLVVLFLAVFSLLFIIFLVVSNNIAILSEEFRVTGILGAVISVLFIVANLFVMISRRTKFKFIRRYNRFCDVLKYRHIHLIDDLADLTGKRRTVVIKDLKRAVKEGFIPQGHFSNDCNVFITNNVIYEDYSRRYISYDNYFRKMADNRIGKGLKSDETQKALNQGKYYLDRIKDGLKRVKDKRIRITVDDAEKTIIAILHEININPTQSTKLSEFIRCYTQAITKLLGASILVDARKLRGQMASREKTEIWKATNIVNYAFESIINEFYADQERIMNDEMYVMESANIN